MDDERDHECWNCLHDDDTDEDYCSGCEDGEKWQWNGKIHFNHEALFAKLDFHYYGAAP